MNKITPKMNLKNFRHSRITNFADHWTNKSIVTTAHGAKTKAPAQWTIILVAVCGGVFLGALFVVLIYRMHSRYKQEKEKENRVARVSFKLPPPRMDEIAIKTQTKYPQEEYDDNDNRSPLDPEIYREEDKEEGSPFMGTAKLCFSLNYDQANEELLVCLLRATRLTPVGENVTVTPYVKIFLLPDKKRKVQSRVLRRTSNPQFFEDFVFAVSPEDLQNRTLEFTVCEFDRFSRQQVIGHVVYPLKDVNVLGSPEGTGEIWANIANQDFKEGVDKGELLFSLQFLPTSCRLTVAVLKARGLKLQGEDNDLDPYVRVSMIMGGKTLKKRKTVANKKTANPVYNEAFVFTLLPSCLDRVSFMLSVFTVTRLGGSKKLIGRAVVGPYMYSTEQGLSHWNDMINSPRNPVAQWHTLI